VWLKVAQPISQNDLQFIFTADGRRTYSFNLPLSDPACYWVPFRLSKHRLSNTLSQRQLNSQAEFSKPTRDDFMISKRKQTKSHSEYIRIYQSSLQCDFCIPNHLVTRPVSKGRLRLHGKTFSTHEKMSWAYCMHNHCFRTCHTGLPQKIHRPSGVPSWLWVCWWLLPCDVCQFCQSGQSFHNQIFQFNIHF